jgi:CheY-like chemotaxis protein
MKKKLNCILLIEDDKATNFYNKEIIKLAGVANQVEITLNGQEAIDYLTNSGNYQKNGNTYPRPDLIFVDITMPKMDGWEFLEEYQKLPSNQKGEVVIVMLTASINPDDQRRAESIPVVNDYKSKPLTVEGLNEIMEKYFAD